MYSSGTSSATPRHATFGLQAVTTNPTPHSMPLQRSALSRWLLLINGAKFTKIERYMKISYGSTVGGYLPFIQTGEFGCIWTPAAELIWRMNQVFSFFWPSVEQQRDLWWRSTVKKQSVMKSFSVCGGELMERDIGPLKFSSL